MPGHQTHASQYERVFKCKIRPPPKLASFSAKVSHWATPMECAQPLKRYPMHGLHMQPGLHHTGCVADNASVIIVRLGNLCSNRADWDAYQLQLIYQLQLLRYLWSMPSASVVCLTIGTVAESTCTGAPVQKATAVPPFLCFNLSGLAVVSCYEHVFVCGCPVPPWAYLFYHGISGCSSSVCCSASCNSATQHQSLHGAMLQFSVIMQWQPSRLMQWQPSRRMEYQWHWNTVSNTV